MDPGHAREIESPEELRARLDEVGHLRDVVVQGVDLGEVEVDWEVVDARRAVFVACPAPSPEVALALQRRGAVVIPDLRDDRPYGVFPAGLYSYEDLVAGGADAAIQAWFDRLRDRTGNPHSSQPVEAIAQRLHDTAMSDGIADLLAPDDGPRPRAVGIMGGHATSRADPLYASVVRLAYCLTRAGFLVVTGGGPGIMEAANLGAYLTRGNEEVIDDAIAELARAPALDYPAYGAAAETVHGWYAGGQGGRSLAIPTWLYAGEPVGRFATHIAKYFANSIREDGLLRIAEAGIVFAPGGAGTVQEVFQSGAINAYGDPAERAPMLFLGVEHFRSSGIWDLVQLMAHRADPPYDDLLAITDDPAEAVAFVEGRALRRPT